MAQELGDIDGLGKRTAAKLREHGIETLEDLASIDPEEAAEDISKVSASRLRGWKADAERSAVIIKTGDQVAQEYDELTKVPTGLEKMDEVLGGGWESGFMVALGGETGSGKTQIAFQAMGEAVEEHDKPAIYIETERGRYRGNRVREMFDDEVQSQVHKISAYDLDQQELAYEKVNQQFGPDDISCVVVDSFTARFRMSDEFTGREDLPNRSSVMARHLSTLDEIAATCDVPVLLTCQISGNPDSYGPKHTIYGGSLMHHMVNFVVFLKSRQGALSELEIRNHPEVENIEFQIQINEDGVDST